MQNAQHRPQWLACSLQNCCHKKQNVIPGLKAAETVGTQQECLWGFLLSPE